MDAWQGGDHLTHHGSDDMDTKDHEIIIFSSSTGHLCVDFPAAGTANAFFAYSSLDFLTAHHPSTNKSDDDTGAQTNHPISPSQLIKQHLSVFGQVNESLTNGSSNITQKPSSLPLPRLQFVHIPKTGGSSAENAAERQKVFWGYILWELGPELTEAQKAFQVKFHRVPVWHLPTHFYFDAENLPPSDNPLANTHVVVIVRNVYSRLISQYYYHLQKFLKRDPQRADSPSNLNRWITRCMKTFRSYSESMKADIPFMEPTGPYWTQRGHLIPQYHYIYNVHKDTNDTAGGGWHWSSERLVHHVLRFENLTSDFAHLMDRYNMSHVQIPNDPLRKRQGRTKLTEFDISPQNLRLIHKNLQT